MTIAAIEWLRNTAFERGLHNYAQWIDEHMQAAIAAGESAVSSEVAAHQVQIAELKDALSAAKARADELEEDAADYKAAAEARISELKNQMAPAASAPAVEPAPAVSARSTDTAGASISDELEQKDESHG